MYSIIRIIQKQPYLDPQNFTPGYFCSCSRRSLCYFHRPRIRPNYCSKSHWICAANNRFPPIVNLIIISTIINESKFLTSFFMINCTMMRIIICIITYFHNRKISMPISIRYSIYTYMSLSTTHM